MTEEKLLRKIALWSEIIADELYVARMGQRKRPRNVECTRRDYILHGIESAREMEGKD